MHTYIHTRTTNATMLFRHKLELLLVMIFTFFAFMAYQEGTGSVAWIQWTTVSKIFFFVWVFDYYFTDDSKFVFDPDADNWRRRTEA